MGKIIIFLVFTTSFSAIAQSVAKSALTPAVALQSLLSPMQSLEAHFDQRLSNAQGQVLEVSSGHFRLKKPNKLYWEIKGEDARLIVSDGKKVWDFDKGLEQVIVQKVHKDSVSAPFLVLSGDLKDINHHFLVQNLETTQDHCLKQSTHCFVLYPKHKEDQSFETMSIGFKKDALQEIQWLDALGQRSEIVFSALRINPILSDSLFYFKPGPEVDILNND